MTEITIYQNKTRVYIRKINQKTKEVTHIYNMPKLCLEDIIEIITQQLINDGCDFTKKADFNAINMQLNFQNLHEKKV